MEILPLKKSFLKDWEKSKEINLNLLCTFSETFSIFKKGSGIFSFSILFLKVHYSFYLKNYILNLNQLIYLD